MRAMMFSRFGGPDVLTRSEVARPAPAADQMLIKVAACGVCGHDLLNRAGHFAHTSFPAVMGHEIAGTVVETLALGVSIVNAMIFRLLDFREPAPPGTRWSEIEKCFGAFENSATTLMILRFMRNYGRHGGRNSGPAGGSLALRSSPGRRRQID